MTGIVRDSGGINNDRNKKKSLFQKYEDALNVYALTGGVAQYVMYFKEYSNIDNAINDLYFNICLLIDKYRNNLLLLYTEIKKVSDELIESKKELRKKLFINIYFTYILLQIKYYYVSKKYCF